MFCTQNPHRGLEVYFLQQKTGKWLPTEGHRAQFHRIWVPGAHMATDTLPADRMGPTLPSREQEIMGCW